MTDAMKPATTPDATDDLLVDLGVRYSDGELSDEEFVRQIRQALSTPAPAPGELPMPEEVCGILAAPEDARAKACEALEFAQGAILDAIGLEEGLDGAAGRAVIGMIRAALTANGRVLTSLPDEHSEAEHQPVEVLLARLDELRRQGGARCQACAGAGQWLVGVGDPDAAHHEYCRACGGSGDAPPPAPAPGWRDIRAEAEAMRERLRVLIANAGFSDTRPVLEIRLETLDNLLDPPAPPTGAPQTGRTE